jgi:hypothetical protein
MADACGWCVVTLQRRKPLGRGKPLQPGGPPARTTPLASVTPLQRGAALQRHAPVSPVSGKRRAENRERRAMAAAMFGGETPLCWLPWCGAWADDLHEPLSRARGGSITDPGNALPLCRPHHDQVTFRPESEIPWAYRLGVLRHSGLCCQGRPACARYAEGGEAA